MNIEYIQKTKEEKNSTREEKKSTKNNQRQCNNAHRARATTELPKKNQAKTNKARVERYREKKTK